MQYNDLILFAFGLGGVLVHNLLKINDLKKRNSFAWSKYYSAEWPSIAISLIVVLLALFGKHEVAQLEQAGKWMGLAFVAIGYMGQSILVKLMGRASKIIDTPDPTHDVFSKN